MQDKMLGWKINKYISQSVSKICNVLAADEYYGEKLTDKNIPHIPKGILQF